MKTSGSKRRYLVNKTGELQNNLFPRQETFINYRPGKFYDSYIAPFFIALIA